MEKKFKLSKYIIPSIISMVVVGTNANIDGFFIGNIFGDDGLAAINIAWPVVALISSIGTGIAIGGSVLFGQLRGKGEAEKGETLKNTTSMLLLVMGLLLGIGLFFISPSLVRLMGGKGTSFTHAVSYLNVICLGAVFQILGAGVVVLLRNDHKTYQSMIYSVAGLVLHIFLDFLLYKKYKMEGVAFATVASQGAVAILGLLTLKTNIKHKINLKYIKDILKESLAPFGINFVPSLVLLFTNIFAMNIGGVAVVSAYAAMSYAVYTFEYIFQGMCDGIQPIISYCKGNNDKAEEKRALKTAGTVLFVFSVVCMLLTPVLIKIIPQALSVSNEATEHIKIGFMIYAFSYPFKACVKFISSYYYASGRSGISNILVFLDPLCLTPLLLWGLTKYFGVNGLWYAFTTVQIVLAMVCILTLRRKSQG